MQNYYELYSNLLQIPANLLYFGEGGADADFAELGRGHAGGLLEAGAEVRHGGKTCHVGYFAQRQLVVEKQFLDSLYTEGCEIVFNRATLNGSKYP